MTREGLKPYALSRRAGENRTDRNENLVDFFREHEIVIADAFDAVRSQVDHHSVPNVEPFRMMVHGLCDEGDTGHVAKGRHKILAFVFLVQFAVDDFPAPQFGKKSLDFGLGQFFAGMARSSGQGVGGDSIMSLAPDIGNHAALR